MNIKPGVVSINTSPLYSNIMRSCVDAWIFNQSSGNTGVSSIRNYKLQTDNGQSTGLGTANWKLTEAGWGTYVTEGTLDKWKITDPIFGDNFNPVELTLEAFVVSSRDGVDPRYISKQTSANSIDHLFMLGGNTTTSQGFSANRIRARFKTENGAYVTAFGDADSMPETGTLYHSVVTYNGNGVNDIKIYKDGKPNTVGFATLIAGDLSGSIEAGVSVPVSFANSAYNNGTHEQDQPILKIAIYDRALSADEVLLLSQDPFGPFRQTRMLTESVYPLRYGGWSR
jgi:hypothetical protein